MKARKRSRGRRAQRGHRRGAFSAQDLFPSGGVAAFFPGVPLGLLGGEMARAGVRASACGLSLKMQRCVRDRVAFGQHFGGGARANCLASIYRHYIEAWVE